MRESISYTVTLNFAITFIIIVFALLSATLIYFKSNKVGNVIVNSIEKYEGYNSLSEQEIYNKLVSIGYNMQRKNCPQTVKASLDRRASICNIVATGDNDTRYGSGGRGYCVYLCFENDYYYYRVRTNMLITVPVISSIVNFPVFSNTNRLYDFEGNLN